MAVTISAYFTSLYNGGSGGVASDDVKHIMFFSFCRANSTSMGQDKPLDESGPGVQRDH